MKEALVVIISFIYTITWGQGLNAELGFNEDYSQKSKGIVAFDDFSVFVKEQTQSASFFTRSSLIKVDTLGNEIWEISITPQSAEVVIISEIIASENNGLYVLGYARPSCDVSGGCFWFLQKVDANGAVDWTRTWSDQVCFGTTVSGLSLTQNNEILVHYNDPLASFIYTISTAGIDLTTIEPNQNGFRGLDKLSGFEAIAYKQFALYGFDGNGNETASKTFSTFISGAQVWNDSLFLLTKDSIFILDNSFQTLVSGNLTSYTDYRNLKVRNQDLRFLSATNTDVSLFHLNHNLLPIENLTINTNGVEDQPIDYSDDHLAIAADFALSEHFTIRHLNYSLNDPQNTPVNRSDIGITDIQITQANLTQNPNFDAVFEVEIDASVLLKNFGPNTLQSCRMNHYISPALACGLIYYGEEFFNLNLAPGDSIWIPLGTIHTNERSFPDDSLNQEICIYTSFPNSITDLNVGNDRLCTTVTFGTASITEISQDSKKLVKVVDILGREIRNPENQWVIRVFSDGSTEKIFQLAD